MKVSGKPTYRSAISNILGAVFMFAIVFTVAIGFFVYTNQSSLQTLEAGSSRQAALQQASSEKVTMTAGLAKSPPYLGDLWVRVNNTGSVPVTIVDVFVSSMPLGTLVSKSTVTVGSNYLQYPPDLNMSLPIAVPSGMSTKLLKGCGAVTGCDIGIVNGYSYKAGTSVVVSVLTSSGNVFSAQYPPTRSSNTNSATTVVTTSSTTTVTSGNPGGAVLVVQMSATPPQTFKCSSCVNDVVTVYNYGVNQVTGVTLTPNPPIISTTGSVSVTSNGMCTTGSTTIPGYSGTGPPPSIVYQCNFAANPNGFGGFASFTGSASGTYNLAAVTSGVAISNTIQIGGPVSVLNQGPFSANFFYFKYSACTNAPSGGHGGSTYSTSNPCVTTPNPMTAAGLNPASTIPGASSYYVAFYITVTNNFNVTIPILPYTYFMTDPTYGGESPFYITGDFSSLTYPYPTYLPNYSPGGSTYTPTLTPYPSTCIVSNTASCIQLDPGKSVTLTFAACDISSTLWDWAGASYGTQNGGSACTTNPPDYQAHESTYLSIVISFEYNGQVYSQDVPFEGQIIS